MQSVKNWFICIIAVVVGIGGLFLFDRIDRSKEDEYVDQYVPSSQVTATQTTSQTQEEDVVDPVALPNTIYAVVGKPLIIRFLNIIEYNSLTNISVTVDANGKGTIFDDRWEFVPTVSEVIPVTFTVKNGRGEIINKSTHNIDVMKIDKKKDISLLVIGDSTIEGGYETKKVLDLASEDGHKLTLLGSRTTSYVQDNKNRHEGRGGWKASTYVEKAESENTGAANPFYNPETKTFDFEYYMAKQGYSSVDCVCLQLGINDMFYAQTDEAVYSDSYIRKYFYYMDKIIESIHAYDSTIKIIWNMILPGSVEQDKFEQAYGDSQTADRYKRNTYLSNLEIVEHIKEKENVYLAPTNASLNTKDNMGQNGNGAVHPAKDGYYEIGTILYYQVLSLMD